MHGNGQLAFPGYYTEVLADVRAVFKSVPP